jgi:hypothetical protein
MGIRDDRDEREAMVAPEVYPTEVQKQLNLRNVRDRRRVLEGDMKYFVLALSIQILLYTLSPSVLHARDADARSEEQAYAEREAHARGLESFEGGSAILIGMLVLAVIVGVGYLIVKPDQEKTEPAPEPKTP